MGGDGNVLRTAFVLSHLSSRVNNLQSVRQGRTPNVEWRAVDCGNWEALGETNRQRPVETGDGQLP